MRLLAARQLGSFFSTYIARLVFMPTANVVWSLAIQRTLSTTGDAGTSATKANDIARVLANKQPAFRDASHTGTVQVETAMGNGNFAKETAEVPQRQKRKQLGCADPSWEAEVKL